MDDFIKTGGEQNIPAVSEETNCNGEQRGDSVTPAVSDSIVAQPHTAESATASSGASENGGKEVADGAGTGEMDYAAQNGDVRVNAVDVQQSGNTEQSVNVPHAEMPSVAEMPAAEYVSRAMDVPLAAAAEKALAEYNFEERSRLAASVVSYIAENSEYGSDYTNGHNQLKAQFPVLKDIDLSCFNYICSLIEKFVGEQRNNLYVAFVLFYIYTCGGYPDKYWKEALLPAAQTKYAAARAAGKQFSSAVASESDVLGKFNEVMKDYQRAIKRKSVTALMRDDDGLGMANIYEMFWDVFVNKYCNYNVTLWKRTIGSYRGKTHTVRHGTYKSKIYNCEYAKDGKKVQIYAVSYTGCQEKPMHAECEDYCLIKFHDDDTWLAVSCDGVGSCSYSSIGSRAAAEALSAVIEKYLTGNSILNKDNKGEEKRGMLGKLFPSKDKKALYDDEKWGKLMYYLQNNLAADVYESWRDTVNEAQRVLGINTDDLSQYTTTLQFAFGCKAFVACGRVGDGRFFVGKHEGAGNASIGGFMLNDGISGVTQPAVYTVVHLKNNPHALQISFFNPDELDDIIISSDGCDSYLGDSVPSMLARAREFNALVFSERCKKLASAARQCAELNGALYGSGDDSTIMHIHFIH